MKTFYGGIFIEKEKLEKEGIYHPIKLEYYKRINEDENFDKSKNRFGISVIKTEYFSKDIKVERKDIKYLTDDENEVNKVLKLFKENEVTPIAVEDIICDLYHKAF